MNPRFHARSSPLRRAAMAALRDQRHNAVAVAQAERFHAIYESVNDGIFLQQPGGLFLEANHRMGDLLGLSRQELLTRNLGRIGLGLSPYSPPEALAWEAKAMAGEAQVIEWLAADRADHLVWLEIRLQRVTVNGRELLLGTARDVGGAKRVEMEQQSRLRRAEAQNAVSLALAGVGLDHQAALDLIAQHLAVQVGDLCLLRLLDDAERLCPAALSQCYVGGNPFLPELSQLAPRGLNESGPGQALASGEPLRISDPEGVQLRALVAPEFHPYMEKFAIHSLLVVPMRHQGKVVGTFTLIRGGAGRPYSVEDQAMLQNLADRAALTLSNAKLYAENLAQADALRIANVELEQRVEERTAELAQANTRLQQLASQDGLTGLANRRQFDSVLDEELRRARRSGDRLALLLCDVDFFKRYNDHYGHFQGDTCLQAVGEVMRSTFRRAGELPARYGGEEFAVILPGLDAEACAQVGQKLVKAMAQRNLPHEKSDAAPHVSLSIGLVSVLVNDETSADALITAADECLYRAKAGGRNRAIVVG